MNKLFSLIALAPLWLSAQVPQIGSSVQFKDTRTSTNTALSWLDTNKPTRTSGAVDPTANCSKADLYVQTATRHLWVCFGASSNDWLDIGFVGGSASFASIVGDPTDNVNLGAALNLKADLTALASHTSNVSNPHSTTKTQVGLASVVNALQLQASLNLSDLNNSVTARSNLGLGGAAILNVGSVAGTVAAGDHLHTSTYAALVHGHSAADITSGLLNISRIAGGGPCDSTTVVYGDQVCRVPPGSSGGEANTASNQGTVGVGIFKSKLGVDLGLYKLNAASTKLSISLNATDHIDFDVVPGNIDHQTLSGVGSNTHTQIDAHLAATNNPHGTTASQVSAPALTVMTTLGDLPYRDGSTWVRLAGNTAASKRLLCQTGTGTISAAPTWCALVAGDIPTLNQNTTGSAASLSAASALPNGTTTTTQTQADNSTKVASTAYVDTGLATRASSTASTTVNGTTCTLGSTCTVADSTKQPTSTKDVNGGYVGRDSSGNASIPGTMAAGVFSTAYTGAAQLVELKQGTAPSSPAANSFQFRAPTSIPTAYFWTVPGADASGCIQSNGSGVLSIASCGSGGSVNVNGSTVSSPNLNTTTPAAETGYKNAKLQVSGSSVSIEVANPTVSELPGEYYAISTGSSNSYVVAPTNAVTSYVTGEKYYFKSSFANTGAATVTFSGLGSKTIKKVQGAVTTDLDTDDIRSGQMVSLVYDGTNMQMVSQLGNAATSGGGTTVSVNGSSVSTPDFNTTTPAAETGYKNAKFQVTGSSVSVEVANPTVSELPGEYYAVATGSANAYVVAPTNAVTAYSTGEKYYFLSNFANTAAATANFNGVGAKTIKKVQGGVTTDLVANDIRSGQQVAMIYDGTNMQMVSQLGNASSGDFSSNTSTSVDGEVVLFSGTAGKTGKRATGTGIARLASGVQSAAELSGDATTSGSNAVTLATKLKTTRALGYELSGTGTSGVLQAADFTAAFAAAINDANAKTLTEASCISDTGDQTIVVSVGGSARFTIHCVVAGSYSRSTTDGSTGYIIAASMTNTAIAEGAVLDITGTANGTTKDVKVFGYGTVN